MFESAFGTAFALILMALYFDVRKLAGYAWVVDIVVFSLTMYLFKGTYSGMMTGFWAGLIFTGFLRVVRLTMGYKQIVLARKKGQLLPRIRWEIVK